MHPPEELYRRMAAAHNAGWQVCIHAIGDAANKLCAELYARLFKEYPRKGCRHRIEHASIMDEKTMQGAVAAGHRGFHAAHVHTLGKRLAAQAAGR